MSNDHTVVMSVASTPNDSPATAPIMPLHNPDQAAHIVVPQAPLGNATNGAASQAPGMGAKALLAKRLKNRSNPMYISPTDNLMTPCTQKLTAAKKKHFTKPVKSVSLFESMPLERDDDDSQAMAVPNEEDSSSQMETQNTLMDDDENPF